MDDNKKLIEEVERINDILVVAGANAKTVSELMDAVGKLATSLAVEATTKGFIEVVKNAAEEGKKEYEAKHGDANKSEKPEKEDS